MWRDFSLSALAAGFVAVLVGFASSVAIVFQAAAAAGADQAIMASWILALGLGMGITCIGLSLYFKAPVLTAWSTPGAALLVSSLQGLSLAEAVGVFIFAAALSLLLGLTGWFEKLSNKIPLQIASAMLAGILFNFGLSIFTSLQQDLYLVGLMCATYLLAKQYQPRYAIPLVLVVAVLYASLQGQLSMAQVHVDWPAPVWIWPEWSVSALIGVGLPLFIVTLTSQNIPGLAVFKSSGYDLPVSPLINASALTTIVLAPLGAFSINLAAITAAICASPEAHSDPAKRYSAGVAAGIFYLLTGLAGAAVVALFAAFPTTLVTALAGLALLGTIGTNLALTTQAGSHREAAIVTLLVTVSGVNFIGIASAFWGLVAGLVCMLVLKLPLKKTV
jgi:benzoate membrane transport protein